MLTGLLLLGACRENRLGGDAAPPSTNSNGTEAVGTLRSAKGFSFRHEEAGTWLTVRSPWAGAKDSLVYWIAPKGVEVPEGMKIDARVTSPVQRLIVTSTTHLPPLEALGATDLLVGFPQTDLVSSSAVRKRIEEGNIAEIGRQESLNPELTLAQRPDLVVVFGLDADNSAFLPLERAGIPVVYNGEWTESNPLGRAEWVKFFGLLLDKERRADSVYDGIEARYRALQARVDSSLGLAGSGAERPKVLSGSPFKDVWYVPGGSSWTARLIEDAGGAYPWSDSPGSGSLNLSLEAVLVRAADASHWIGPGQYTTYDQMVADGPHFERFQAFRERQAYTYSARKGPTGGVLYFERAAQHPDEVLADLVHILHPELLPDRRPVFFTPLK